MHYLKRKFPDTTPSEKNTCIIYKKFFNATPSEKTCIIKTISLTPRPAEKQHMHDFKKISGAKHLYFTGKKLRWEFHAKTFSGAKQLYFADKNFFGQKQTY